VWPEVAEMTTMLSPVPPQKHSLGGYTIGMHAPLNCHQLGGPLILLCMFASDFVTVFPSLFTGLPVSQNTLLTKLYLAKYATAGGGGI